MTSLNERLTEAREDVARLPGSETDAGQYFGHQAATLLACLRFGLGDDDGLRDRLYGAPEPVLRSAVELLSKDTSKDGKAACRLLEPMRHLLGGELDDIIAIAVIALNRRP